MTKRLNYLLGFGERYNVDIQPPTGGGPKKHPYTAAEARERLGPQLEKTITDIESLPQLAFPNDEAVISVTIHPAYLAKSHYPDEFFRLAQITPLGSRLKMITPDKWAVQDHPDAAQTSEFFASAPRTALKKFAAEISLLSDEDAESLKKIELIAPPSNLIKNLVSDSDYPLLEIALHAYTSSHYILEGFREYLKSLDVVVDLDKRIHAEGLCFLPVRAQRKLLPEIGKFSFLRVAREMPPLRTFMPTVLSLRSDRDKEVELPDSDPLDSNLSVAIFDGGLPAEPNLERYVNHQSLPGLAESVREFEDHGLAVTSALLFSSIAENPPLGIPFSKIDHYRVLDAKTEEDSQMHLYSVLQRISSVLQDKHYDFINLSIGPELPIEDEDVHAWTAVLDPLLAHGQTLATIAVGNGGQRDSELRFNRIQTPSDCVNALSVGSADSQGFIWKRALHSSVGLGRHPGLIKPDCVSFGGSHSEPFYVLSSGDSHTLRAMLGTSFAAPNALRTAVGLRAILGKDVSTLAIRTLLLHRCEESNIDVSEVGRGRILKSIDELMSCEDDTVHVVYQGSLEPAKWIQAKVPVPFDQMRGYVEIKYTLCFACEVDPQDLLSYTRGGLELRFRPNIEKTWEDSSTAKTKTVAPNRYLTEQELRDDWHKWETVWSQATRVRGSNLKEPVIDIHYLAREKANAVTRAPRIPYALVVTVRNSGMNELYNQIVQKYQLLQQLRPAIEIPIQT